MELLETFAVSVTVYLYNAALELRLARLSTISINAELQR